MQNLKIQARLLHPLFDVWAYEIADLLCSRPPWGFAGAMDELDAGHPQEPGLVGMGERHVAALRRPVVDQTGIVVADHA